MARMTEWQRENAIEELQSNDQELYEWLPDIDTAIIDWFDEQPIYRETFIRWARGNKVLMEKWHTHCWDVVDGLDDGNGGDGDDD